MDPGETLDDDGSSAEVSGLKGCVLPTASLTVVLFPHDNPLHSLRLPNSHASVNACFFKFELINVLYIVELGAQWLEHRTGDRMVLGLNPAGGTSLQNFPSSVYPALPVSFGGDTKSRQQCIGLMR